MYLMNPVYKLVKRTEETARPYKIAVISFKEICFPLLASYSVTGEINSVYYPAIFKIAIHCEVAPLAKAATPAKVATIAKAATRAEAATRAKAATRAEAAIRAEDATLAEAATRAKDAIRAEDATLAKAATVAKVFYIRVISGRTYLVAVFICFKIIKFLLCVFFHFAFPFNALPSSLCLSYHHYYCYQHI